jgi:signal transduction histidine kinase/CheY-like chemotaxis protein
VFRIVNEETRHPVENPVAKVLRAGGIVGLANHTVLLSRSGTEYPIADSGSPVLGADGAVIGVVLVFRDQTREREAERTLSEAEQRFRGFFESAVPGIALHQIEVGADGIATGYRYLDVNPAFYLQTGLPRESVVGRSAAAVFGTEEAPYLDVYDQVVRTALPKKFEVYFEPLDRHFEIGAFRTGPGQFATVFLDVSGLRRAEKERVELEAQLRQAVKMEAVGRLAGGVAHDFNNMLQVINSCSRLALEVPGVPADAAALVGEIEKAGSRSAVLVRQLLAFARKQPIDPLVLDLNQLVDSSLSMLGRMIGEDIRLAWMPGAELWPVQVDPGQTDQLLVNLVVNARDAIRDVGCITVETSNVSLSEEYCRTNKGFKPGDFVLLAVSDDGCGMDRETLARVFEPFFTTKTLGQGSGLGLATVYGVVKQNDGFINVYSEVGKGTTFRIYLPRSSHEKSELVTPDSAPSDPESVTETVLLVEDEETLLRLGTLLLERTGYKVLPCLSPGDAIRTSDEYRGVIHVLLTDVVMPEMNGRELYQRLVQSRPEMKCLYMSGYTANVIVHHGVLQRGVQFIEKPFSRESLASKLRETLRG